jgi:hypothetical protein
MPKFEFCDYHPREQCNPRPVISKPLSVATLSKRNLKYTPLLVYHTHIIIIIIIIDNPSRCVDETPYHGVLFVPEGWVN